MALMQDIEVLILDEVTSGLDPIAWISLKLIIDKLLTKRGNLIITSHILDDIQNFCDQLIILKNGKIVFDGQMDSFQNNQRVLEIKLSDIQGNI